MKHNIIRQQGATDLNLAQLRKAVLKEIQILEASEETNKLNYFSNPLYSVPSTSSLLANASKHKEHERGLNPRSKQLSSFPKPRPCVFCKGSHKPNDCKKVSDPAARKLIVSQANLCFNCLNNHRVSQCKSKNRCRQCHQKHHTSLCLDIKKPNEQHELNAQKDIKDKDGNLQCSCTCTNNAPTPGTTITVQQTPPHSTSTLASNLHTNLSDNKHLQRRALLKTAIATVESPEKTATAHILFDEGAQRSFITEALAKKLNLTADKTETLHLSVFGGDHTIVKKFDDATVNLRTDNGQTIPIRVVVIPVIAVPQKNHVTTAIHDLPYLKGLKLAHPVTEKMKTDIYVDNLASGSDNEDDASTFLENARLIMSPVGFNPRSWNSNHVQIRASAEQQRLHDKDPEPKVLGLRWNTHTDKLKFQQQHVTSSDNTNGITKREVLREASKIYDPLGLLTPVTIRAKILMHKLWKRNYSWDQPLSQELQRKWLTLSEDLKTATQTEVSRRYFPSSSTWSAIT